MTRSRQAGQAAVEGLGIGVLVAVLLAAITGWLIREVRLPERPPAVVAAAATPLERDPLPFETTYPLTRHQADPPAPSDEPIERFVRASGRTAREVAAVAAAMQVEFGIGFGSTIVARGRQAVSDPLALLEGPSLDDISPAGLLRHAGARASALRAYARRLREMPLRQALYTASHDVGAFSGNVAYDIAEAWVRRRVVDGVSRRLPGPREGRTAVQG